MKGLWSQHFPDDEPKAAKGDVSPCKTKGLWSDLFPAADKPSPTLARSQRCLLCPRCNAATCRLVTSNTNRNPGRQFYKCPFDNDFIKWADEVHANEFIDVPYCGGCTAGVCRVRRETSGPNAGRILFMCRVKEGAGSCGYRVWQDELEKAATAALAEERINSYESTLLNCNDTSTPKSDLVGESRQADEGPDIVSPIIDTSEHLQCRQIISGKMGQSICQEDKLSDSSRRPHKRSRCGDAKGDESTLASFIVGVSHLARKVRKQLEKKLPSFYGAS